ncbi:hypothetical protein [Pedobacter montanisoli]|uniref:Baseplate protein J-like domain-containing protein n=1 Tax=Pedobacter montanisoli TaxID=2923277 RepID=A0ABS9ZXR9_9SPHI|nr:hypothetical protein [Pedobacter montanisoli]MCJ0743117.1 hypothetical protein [Pedobacter montanisoli]
MPNNNAFCSDYSSIKNCLVAIQLAARNGDFNDYPEVLQRINSLDSDFLRKLYLRVITILGILNGEEGFPEVRIDGDFDELDFDELDFWVGFSDSNISGDFFKQDFFELDFWVGFMDSENDDYVAVFQTILNIFKEFCMRSDELGEYEKALIDASLQPFLDAFAELQNLLESLGINPCTDSASKYYNNSKEIFLQVAGSDGFDNIAEGFHLRWSLAGALAENHLPKGDYFTQNTNSNGFNKSNDFIKVYRTPYQDPVIAILDFETVRPVVNSARLYWTYTINQTVNGKIFSNQVRLYFTDQQKYYQLATTLSPNTDSFNFINNYDAVIEAEVIGKTGFSFNFELSKTTSGTSVLKVEAHNELNENADQIRLTQNINQGTTNAFITGDNISLLKVKKSADVKIRKLSFETYHDFYHSRSLSNWQEIGDGFALDLTDTKVFERLENASYPIDNLWPQYNDGTRVKVNNYKDKWSGAYIEQIDQNVKELVQLYLTKSETDPRAYYRIFEDGTDPAQGQDVSLLDILNLQALDYHMARMLGLGHIDTPGAVAPGQQYIYRISYQNKKTLGSTVVTQFNYMSLPVSKQDKRLPGKPVMRPVNYNLYAQPSDFVSSFDEYGYGKLDQIRVVNIGRDFFNSELKAYDFFADLQQSDNENFCLAPKPVFYGIEYRASNSTTYVKPEITSTEDPAFGKVYYAYDNDFPVTGIPEVTVLPDDPYSLFVHFERNPGVHYYAIYGVNWFSRSSVLSDEEHTDETVFTPNNQLIPPTDLAVQYIQKEDELIFTTSIEQGWYQKRALRFPGQDIGLTRITFNWLDIVDVSSIPDITPQTLQDVVRANETNIFFKPALQKEVVGIISDIRSVSGTEDQLLLYTSGYQLITGELKKPTINNTDLNRFTGSILSTNEGQFKVLSVYNDANDLPVITIEKLYKIIRTEEDEEEGMYGAYKEYTVPVIGSRFSLVENLGNENNWFKLNEKIQLVSYADEQNPVIEVESAEGGDSRFWVGGIHGNAIITKVTHVDEPFDGYYQISFDQTALPDHPQVNIPYDPQQPDQNEPGSLHGPHVEWYGGVVRIDMNEGTEKKLLQVLILQQNNPLKLYVYDAGYATNPIKFSATETDYIQVNYHPGYRAYLFAEPEPVYQFNAQHILPGEDDNDKRTLMAIQTVCTSLNYTSSVSTPAVLLARNIYEPKQPDTPVAAGLKVRPDATKKAAFTFDMRIPPEQGAARKPFGFMFYRTSHQQVLSALYEPQTIDAILADLASLSSDLYYNQRYLDMVHLDFENQTTLQFKVYNAEPQPYGFPSPDKAGLIEVGDTTEQKMAKLQAAVFSTLLPLTEQPPILRYLEEGLQTSNQIPVIRDADGNLLDPGDPRFKPFPMVRYYTKDTDVNATYIRFTDYLLDSSYRDLYFYAGVEVNNLLNYGPLSPFLGLVEVLQTTPALPPVIQSYTFVPATVLSDNDITVQIKIALIPEVEHISKLRIYRTAELSHTLSVIQMEYSFDVDIDPLQEESYEITDDFSGIENIPLGKTMYYRVAGIRIINNEEGENEEILSYPSELFEVQLIDLRSPDAPLLVYDDQQNKISWNATTDTGSYYLYKQNNRGNWEHIYSVLPPLTNAQMDYEIPAPLNFTDEDGDRIYHRFKVQVENLSGRMNIIENELTI